MAIIWGTPVKNSRGWEYRVGIERVSSRYDTPTLTAATTKQTILWRAYIWSKYPMWSNATKLDGSGEYIYDFTKTISYDHKSYTAWSSSNITKVYEGEHTVSLFYGQATVEQAYFTIYGHPDFPGVSAKATYEGTIPARPYYAPSPPTWFSVTRSSDSYHTLKWTNGATTEAEPRQGITLQRWSAATNKYETFATAGSTATSYVDRQTLKDNRYRWRIRSFNQYDYSDWVYSSYIKTTPDAPGSVVAKKSGSSIVLTIDNKAAYADYLNIVWRVDGGAWLYDQAVDISGGSVSWTHTSPPQGKVQYSVRSKADNLASGYTLSNEVQVLAPPLAPTPVEPKASTVAFGTSVTTVWKHNPVDTTDQQAYEFQWRPAGGTWNNTGKVTSSSDSRLLGQLGVGQYEWQVRTWGDFSNPSPWSELSSFRVATEPSATITNPPGNLVESNQLYLDWTFSDDATTQTKWIATLYDSSGESLEVIGGRTATAGTFKTVLANNQYYRVELDVWNGYGLKSAFPAVLEFDVVYKLPAVPTLKTQWVEDNGVISVEVAHGVVDGTTLETVRLELERSEGDSWVPLNSSMNDHEFYLDMIPALNTLVSYRVKAISSLGSYAYSSTSQVFTDARIQSWAMWNWGPSFHRVAQAQFDLQPSDSPKVDKTLHHFEGRTYPVEYMADDRNHSFDISFTLDGDSSSKRTFTELYFAPAPVCYRLPNGEKHFVSVQSMSFDESKVLGDMTREIQVKMTMERVSFDE